MQIYHPEDENMNDAFYFDNIKTYGSQEEELNSLIHYQQMENIEVCDGVMSVDALEIQYDLGDNSDPYDMIELAEDSEGSIYGSDSRAYCTALGY